ncbi:hypothetical protein ACFLZZ_02255 [Nanoarchaeota archaeon]
MVLGNKKNRNLYQKAKQRSIAFNKRAALEELFKPIKKEPEKKAEESKEDLERKAELEKAKQVQHKFHSKPKKRMKIYVKIDPYVNELWGSIKRVTKGTMFCLGILTTSLILYGGYKNRKANKMAYNRDSFLTSHTCNPKSVMGNYNYRDYIDKRQEYLDKFREENGKRFMREKEINSKSLCELSNYLPHIKEAQYE